MWIIILCIFFFLGIPLKGLTTVTDIALGEFGMFDPEWYLTVLAGKELPPLIDYENGDSEVDPDSTTADDDLTELEGELAANLSVRRTQILDA